MISLDVHVESFGKIEEVYMVSYQLSKHRL